MSDSSKNVIRINLELAATLEEVDRAAHVVERSLADKLGPRELFGILIGLREAVTNAVIHGSSMNPQSTINCEICVEDGLVRITVADQGDGFDWRNGSCLFPDPDVPGRRGLGILATYFDELIYNEKGNKLLLTRRLP